MLNTFEIGVRYHLIHAISLLGLAALSASRPRRWTRAVGWLFFLGIIIFAGSLYTLAITGQKWLGMITPIGGGLFLIGWLTMGVGGVGGVEREVAAPRWRRVPMRTNAARTPKRPSR